MFAYIITAPAHDLKLLVTFYDQVGGNASILLVTWHWACIQSLPWEKDGINTFSLAAFSILRICFCACMCLRARLYRCPYVSVWRCANTGVGV